MTLPKDDLAVEIAPGADIIQDPSTWAPFWVDLCEHTTAYPDGRVQWPITINKGRSSEGSQASPSSCEFDVRNEDGALSPDNPLGPWYGKLGLNTPLRIMWGTSERFLGLVSELPTSWLNLVENSRSTIRADGITRRLQQGSKPLSSALVRAFQRRSDVVAYWPCEDDAGATQAASPLKSLPPIMVDPRFAEFDTGEDIPAGSAPGLLSVKAGSPTVLGDVPIVTTDNYSADQMVRFDEPTASYRTAHEVFMSSSLAARFQLSVSSTQIRFRVFDNDGIVVLNNGQPIVTAFFGGWTWSHIRIEASGSDLSVGYITRTADAEFQTLNSFTGIIAGARIGHLSQAGFFKGTASAAPAERLVGHILVATDDTEALWADAVHAFTGERAGDRFERLCEEEGLPYVLIGDAADTMPMGPQQREDLLSNFQSIENADGGILHDLEYRTRASLYNQTPTWDLDFCDLNGSPRPLYDDKNIRNDITTSRPDGGSAQIMDQPHIERYGRYDDTPEANVEHDSLLEQIAAWLVHLGTVEEMRWPSIPVSINSETQHLLADWQALRIGDRLTIPHDIPQLPGVTIDLLVEGWQEIIHSRRAEITLNCRPAQPWTVFELEHATRGRLTSPRAYIAEAINSTDTAFNIVVPVRQPWNVDPGFEEGAVIKNTHPDDSHGWATFAGTLERTMERAHGGRWSGKFTPDDAASDPDARTSRHDLVGAGIAVQGSIWVMAPNALSGPVRLVLSWFFPNIFGPSIALTPGVWTRLFISGPKPSDAVRGLTMLMEMPGVRPATDIVYIDDGEIGLPGVPWTTDPADMPFDITIGGEVMAVTAIGAIADGMQQFTVARAVNGVQKPHAAGSPMTLHPQHVMAL